MRTFWRSGAAILLVAAAAVSAQQPPSRQTKLKPGSIAPTFALKDVDDKERVDLGDLKGKPVVLIFGSCT
jgi:cytochrome oxidase Cu insertion factor (SCO1/SenC/PrrC family)